MLKTPLRPMVAVTPLLSPSKPSLAKMVRATAHGPAEMLCCALQGTRGYQHSTVSDKHHAVLLSAGEKGVLVLHHKRHITLCCKLHGTRVCQGNTLMDRHHTVLCPEGNKGISAAHRKQHIMLCSRRQGGISTEP